LAIEVEVSGEELDKIRKMKREIDERFKDLDGLERTLKYLRMKILLEQRERLLKKLNSMEVHYRELLEFERKAREDREYMLRVRNELSLENEELRKRLGGRDGGSR